ncbi:MAG: carbohydrate binding domain-containing protein [Coprococcus sp.]|nr:carbohydrate binding domain-containing protein [Coprococcus sp.]
MGKLKKAIAMFMVIIMVTSSMSFVSDAATTKKQVTKVSVTNVKYGTVVLKKNKTYKLKVKVSRTGGASKKVTFKSSNPSVVKVSSTGKMKALKKGSATITVRSKFNRRKKATVKVVVGTPVTKVKLNKSKASGYVGNKIKLKATVSPRKASVKKVKYTTSNKSVATVNSKGVVTLKKVGKATITATATDNSKKKAKCTITVKRKKTETPTTEKPTTEEPTTEEPTTEEPSTEETIPEYEGYTLKWHDEFDGETLNEADWNYETHEPGWVNNELQEYVKSDENVYLKDGKLVIKPVKKGEGENATYTSGRINTQNKHDFTYGRFEVKAKVPEGAGYLPAFWMMPTDENLYGQWPRCGEIDIMEVMGSDTTKAYGTIHYGNPHAESQGTKVLTSGNYADEYHVFSCEWEPGSIKWYIDGVLYHEENDWHSTTVGQGTVSYPAPFDQPFYLILNLAVGGSWVGYPDENTDFENQAFVIDYVRAYQKDSYDENVKKPEKEVILRDPDENGNYTNNGDFSVEESLDDDENWKFLTALGGKAEAKIADKEIVISTTDAGTVDYSVQLVQAGIPLKRGNIYTVSFDAYADEDRSMIVDVSAPDRSYQRYLSDTKVDLTTDKQNYSYTFNMEDKDDANGRLEFNLGNTDKISDVHISNVKIECTGTFVIDDSKKVLADGNYVYNGSFQEGENRLDYWLIEDAESHAKYEVTSLADGRRLKLSTSDCELGDVKLKQTELPLAANGKYVLSFDAEANGAHSIAVNIAGNTEPFVLSEKKQTYTYSFSTGDDVDAAAIEFALGVNGIVYLDNIRVVEDTLIKNGSFNAGTSGFEVYAYTTSDVNYVVDSISEDNAFDITIKDTNDADWKIQLKQNNVKLEKDQCYRLSFDIKSSIARSFVYAIQRDGSVHKDANGNEDWMPYVQENVKLEAYGTDGAYTHIEKCFKMKEVTDAGSIFNIALGGGKNKTQHRVCIDNIVLEKIDESEMPKEPEQQTGTNLLTNGDFSNGVEGWTGEAQQKATGTWTFTDGAAKVVIETLGDATPKADSWHVNLKQTGLTLKKGCEYEVKVTLTSNVTRTAEFACMDANSSNWYVMGDNSIALTADEPQTVTFKVGVGDNDTDTSAYIGFNLGKIAADTPDASTITIDDVSMVLVSGDDTPSDPE